MPPSCLPAKTAPSTSSPPTTRTSSLMSTPTLVLRSRVDSLCTVCALAVCWTAVKGPARSQSAAHWTSIWSIFTLWCPCGRKAYVLTATAVPVGGLGYLTLWPQGQAQPLVATQKAADGVVTSILRSSRPRMGDQRPSEQSESLGF